MTTIYSGGTLQFSLLAATVVLGLNAQRPQFIAEGVANAASFAPVGVAPPGAIISIFGKDLAADTVTADSAPLPRELGGTSVNINGLSAPLFFVSPTQINLQVPFGLYPGFGEALPQSVPIVVRTARGQSDPVMVSARGIGGIYAASGGSCGPAVAFNAYPDGTSSVVSATNSAIPGQYISLFGTGLGFYRAGREGEAAKQPWEGTPSAFTRSVLEVGYDEFRISRGSQLWLGLAPGLIGVEQGIFQLGANAPEGCTIPVRITRDPSNGGGSTQSLTLPISRTGRCTDPPDSRFARIRWTRTFRSTSEGFSTSISFRARFVSAMESLLPSPPTAHSYLSTVQYGSTPLATRQCPGSEPDPVDVGALTLATGVRTISIPSAAIYETSILDNGAGDREWTVMASGHGSIQPFRTAITLPEPLKFTTDLRPGTVFPYDRLTPLKWTGGKPGSSVYLLVTMYGLPFVRWSTATDAEQGETYLAGKPMTGPIPLEPTENLTLHFIVISKSPAQVTIPGFPAGAVHEWVDEYIFTGLRIRNTPPPTP